MINGTKTEEQIYRKLDFDSSSSLKEFSLDKRKYYKKYILNERVEEEESKASIVGSLVDCLLLTPDDFDSKYYLSALSSAPTGNMLLFVESLYKHSQNTELEFSAVMREAYKDSGYKWTFDKVVEKFVGSDAEIYFQEIKAVRSKNLTVITLNDIQNAERIVEELKTNEFTAEIINQESNERFTVLNQFQVSDYELDGIRLKSMIDKVIVDTRHKIVYIYDLKCSWSVEGFLEEYYLYRRAYIQAYLYRQAVLSQFASEGYTVAKPKFIVCDSINYFSPLIYTTSDENLREAYEGFEYKGRTYPGVKEIIEDLKWAKEKNIWNISRKNYINKGIVDLKP